MSEETTTTETTQTTETAKPEPSLDELLNEFSQPEQPKVETQTEQPKAEVKPNELEEIRQFRNEIAAERTRTEVEKTVQSIQEAHKAELGWMNKAWIEGRLDAEARRDPRIQQAFLNRGQNPAAWNKVVQKLGERLAEETRNRPDPQLTQDREAARAAVSGQTATMPSKPELDPAKVNRMSIRELEELAKSYKRRA